MRKYLLFLFFFLAILPVTTPAQKIITTIAGGGPNNLPVKSANLWEVAGAVKDSSGNFYIADTVQNRVYRVDANGVLTVFAGNGVAGYSGDGGPAVAAELQSPTGLYLDGSGNLFIADTLNNVIREVVAATGKIQTVAGNGIAGYSGDNGPATSASLNGPEAIFMTQSGTLYISEEGNNVIRRVSAGTIQTAAGMGPTYAGYSGDGGPATSAKLYIPVGLSGDASGNIFIADSNNNVIREIVAATGIIQTVAGNGTCGYTGDQGAATSAKLCDPHDVFVDGSGNLFIADTFNAVVREVSGGTIQTVAGNGTRGYSGDGGPATSAKLSDPLRVFVDGAANLYISDDADHVIREVSGGTIQTFAGSGVGDVSGDGALATDAFLAMPWGVVFDASGNIYFTAWNSHVVGKISATTGKLQIIAGTGVAGFSGDGGPAKNAQFSNPCGIALDQSGNIYVSDENNHRVRKIDAATGNISTIAGTGLFGYSGNGGPAINAVLGFPTAVYVDNAGNVFFSDAYNHVISEIVATTGIINTVAGNGIQGFAGDGGAATSAELNQPFGIYVAASGNLFISDSGNSRIREVTASNGVINTIAGTGVWGYTGDGGPALSAELQGPDNVVVDAAGNIFIADVYNNAIREVVSATGNIQTVAGTGKADFSGDGGPATLATIQAPASVTVDPSGNFVLADMNNNRIRSVSLLAIIGTPAANLSPTSLTFSSQTVGTTSTAQAVTLTNNSTKTLNITSITASGTNSGDFGEADNCTPSVAAGATCTINVTFTPSAAGSRAASVVLTDNASDSPQSIQLSGTGSATATSTAVLSSLNPSTFGQSLTFTATVSVVVAVVNKATTNARATPEGAKGVSGPTGTVTFLDGATQLGTGTLDLNGQATFTTSTLSAGTHPITASYGGDAVYLASTSAVLSQVVNANDFALSSTTPTQTVVWGAAANYTVTVTPQPGGTFPGTVNLSASGLPTGAVATFNPTSVASAGSATNVTMTIQTPAQAAITPVNPPHGFSTRTPRFAVPFLTIAALCLAWLLKRSDSKGRKLIPSQALLVLWFTLASAMLWGIGCNGGFPAPPNNPLSTSYTVTVTASSGTLQHTTSVTLTVQ